MFNKEVWLGVFTFVGLVIGAGIFALPYVFSNVGFLIGLVHILLVSLIMIYVCLCLGEVILRTKEKHQITGLAEKYLGKEGKIVIFISTLVSLYGAMIAYAIGAGVSLNALFGWNATYWAVIFILVLSVFILAKLNIFEDFEAIFTPIKLLMILILVVIMVPFIKTANLSAFNPSMLHVPFGVVLFALTGFFIIPDIAIGLRNRKSLKHIIVIGILLSAVIYVLFALGVVGVLGDKTSEVATTSLGHGLGGYTNLLANIFALLAFSTAFVAVGFALKENFVFDYKVNNKLAWFLVLLVPLIFMFLGKISFVKIVSITGILGTGIGLLAIIVMHSRAVLMGDIEPEYKVANIFWIKFVIIFLLLLGIFYELAKVLF